MTTIETLPRTERMRQWMAKNEITDRSLAEKLGLKRSRVTRMLNEETMPTEHYNACLELGIPADILPIPFNKKRGPRPKEPQFPVCWNPIKGVYVLDRPDEFNPASRRNHANGKESLA